MKISVITAVYNAKETVAHAIESVLAQSHPDIELIVVDGASTDGTLEVLETYRPQLDVLISEPDAGIYDALNKGIRLATGDVIGLLHADDLYAGDDVLAKIAGAFRALDVDAVYGDLVYVRKSQPEKVIRYWRAGEFSQAKLKYGWMPPHPSLYLRREVYSRFGEFDTRYRIAADYDFMLRVLCEPGVQCCYIPEVLVKMRTGGASNRSLGNILRKSLEDYRALRANGVGGWMALAWKNLGKLGQFIPGG